MENEFTPVPLHQDLLNDYVEHNSFDEDDDEYISDYIDLILFAIVTQLERRKAYLLNPTTALQDEIRTHETYISNAESSLNVHILRIIRNFKASINYDKVYLAKEQLNEIDDATESTNDKVYLAKEQLNEIAKEQLNEIAKEQLN